MNNEDGLLSRVRLERDHEVFENFDIAHSFVRR